MKIPKKYSKAKYLSDLKAEIKQYQDRGINMTMKGNKVFVSDPDGNEIDDCDVMSVSPEMLAAAGFRLYAADVWAKAADSDLRADGDGSGAKWKKGGHEFIGNGFFHLTMGFHYTVEVKGGSISFGEEWSFSRWPTQGDLTERLDLLIKNYEATRCLLAYLDAKGTSYLYRDQKVYMGPLIMRFDGTVLQITSSGANDLSDILAALGVLVGFSPSTMSTSAPSTATPAAASVEMTITVDLV
jgi:hypothetical protein